MAGWGVARGVGWRTRVFVQSVERLLACTRISGEQAPADKVPPHTVVYAVEANWDKYEAMAAEAKAADAAFLEAAEAAARTQSAVHIDLKLDKIGLGPKSPA